MWRALLLCFLAIPAFAETEVDLELYLAVDVSRSMTPAEVAIQRRGYAAALRSDEVIHAIENGLTGEIALTYVEWAGAGKSRTVIPWTRLSGRDDAERIAATIEAHIVPTLKHTSISSALRGAARSFEGNGFKGLRRVIDISGDGPNNDGGPVPDARDEVVAQGITINGLPLMTRDDFAFRWHIDDLDQYYAACVIGGPGAFAIPVRDWSEFPAAVRKKLVLEIAGLSLEPRIWSAGQRGATAEGYDCLIGEKIRAERRRLYR